MQESPEVARKNKEHRMLASDAPGSVPSPRYFALALANFDYRTGQAPPPQPAVIGMSPAPPTFMWRTPSSLEQNMRIPVTLYAAGAVPTTYCTLIPALATAAILK